MNFHYTTHLERGGSNTQSLRAATVPNMQAAARRFLSVGVAGVTVVQVVRGRRRRVFVADRDGSFSWLRVLPVVPS